MRKGVRTALSPSLPVPTSPWSGSRWLRPHRQRSFWCSPVLKKLVIKIAPSACGPPWPASLGSVTGIIGSPTGTRQSIVRSPGSPELTSTFRHSTTALLFSSCGHEGKGCPEIRSLAKSSTELAGHWVLISVATQSRQRSGNRITTLFNSACATPADDWNYGRVHLRQVAG